MVTRCLIRLLKPTIKRKVLAGCCFIMLLHALCFRLNGFFFGLFCFSGLFQRFFYRFNKFLVGVFPFLVIISQQLAGV